MKLSCHNFRGFAGDIFQDVVSSGMDQSRHKAFVIEENNHGAISHQEHDRKAYEVGDYRVASNPAFRKHSTAFQQIPVYISHKNNVVSETESRAKNTDWIDLAGYQKAKSVKEC